MASIGYIHGVLTLSTKAFEAGLHRAQSMTERFTSFLSSRVVISVETLARSITAVPAAFQTAMRDAMEFGSEIATLAGTMNVSTDAIQELQFAAQQTNVSFDNLVRAMRALTNFLGRQATTNDLLDQVRVLQSIPSAALRAAEAHERFGKSYVGLLPLINGGTDALKSFEMAVQSKRGRLVSEQEVANLARANDAIASMNDAWASQARIILGRVAPALERLAGIVEAISKWVANLFGLWLSGIDMIVNRLAMLSRTMASMLSVLGDNRADVAALRKLADSLDAMRDGWRKIFAPLGGPNTRLGDDSGGLDREPQSAATFTRGLPAALMWRTSEAISAINRFKAGSDSRFRDPNHVVLVDIRDELREMSRGLGLAVPVSINGASR